MSRFLISIIYIIIVGTSVFARGGSGETTDYSFRDCEGSLTPYPEITELAGYPDSLTPVFINHVGRHGSRFPASDAHCRSLQKVLRRATELGTITPLGCRLNELNDEIIRRSAGKWGALDSLGEAEQSGIAGRLLQSYRELFSNQGEVIAISSHSPRSIASAEAFISGLGDADSPMHFTLFSGKEYDSIVRPFDYFKSFPEYLKSNRWHPPYSGYFKHNAPSAPIRRALGKNYPFKNDAEARDLSLIEYYVLAGCSAMSMPNPMEEFFTSEEANALWSCFNLRQYLQRSESVISSLPVEIAAPLLKNIIQINDCVTSEGYLRIKEDDKLRAILRFGHGETILPLVGLMRLPGCRYLTDDFASVARNWHDFDIIPMAANVQFILFRAKDSGNYYCRILLNESPVRLHAEDSSSIYPWSSLREYLNSCLSIRQ
ncbi:MAG: histidine phosphatase family protein [Muribaculaceae bacterium]|nr:histidine phosphatase family protein [Muribaculaceae bacterium]